MNFIKKDINELKYANYNPRKKLTPDDKEYQKIKNSIEEFGYVEPIIINKDNTIIGGHQRLTVLKDLGYTEVDVIQIDIDKTKEKALNIALNKITGEWDYSMLGDLLLDLDSLNYDLEFTGFDLDEIENILAPIGEEKEVVEDDFDIELPEEPKAKYGDIYQLGNHRLMCGDSTKEEDVAKLMNGNKADMVFTDPPYGVDIKGKYTGTILNDDLKDDELEGFLKEVNSNLKIFCNGSFYICYEVLNSVENFNAFGKPDEIICFNKDSASFYSKNKYNRKYELIMFYENGKELYCESETNVWDSPKSSSFNNRDENGLRFNDKGNFCVAHPTTKPLTIPSRAIKNSTKENDSVLDLFGGSGSTLISCEQLNRNCYMMELDPKYVDVIINRWETFTGKKAIKLN